MIGTRIKRLSAETLRTKRGSVARHGGRDAVRLRLVRRVPGGSRSSLRVATLPGQQDFEMWVV